MKELTVKARLALFSSKKCQKRPKYLLLKTYCVYCFPPTLVLLHLTYLCLSKFFDLDFRIREKDD